jgi:hypothetical protein
MSAPINKKENSEENSQDLLRYAPPWARAQATRREPRSTNSLPPAANLGDSKINWPPAPAKLTRFEGDVGMTELRHRLSLDPHIVPEPPLQVRQRSLARSWLTKLPLYIGMAAIVAYAVVELSPSYGDNPLTRSNDGAARASRLTATPGGVTMPIAAPRLVVEDRQTFADEPLSLGVVLVGATGGESVLLNGLVKGTRLSAGEPLSPTGWRVAARELGNLLAYAPSSFIGAMDAEIELRSAKNAHLDIQVGRLEWLKKVPDLRATLDRRFEQPEAMQPDKLSRLIKRGLEFLKDGDIAASRLVLRLAADSGNAQAALMLGATFDPNVLTELGVFGLTGDPATARAWYQKAKEFGSTEASRRIERLAQTVK